MKKLPLMHGRDWCYADDVRGWYACEKLDGYRAYWDGARLLTREGADYQAPDGFTAGLPAIPLDCELYAGPGQRNRLNGACAWRDQGRWRGVRLHVFDFPSRPGDYVQRRSGGEVVAQFAHTVPLWRVESLDAAEMDVRRIKAAGGEGLMLHRPGAPYRPGRVDFLLKLTPAHVGFVL